MDREARLALEHQTRVALAWDWIENQESTITHAEVDNIRRRIGFLLHNLTSRRASPEQRRHIRRRIELLLIEVLGYLELFAMTTPVNTGTIAP
ncbi:hypothetical protein B0H16DRAFT_1749441 [Mycena metata]|uniref:Uncharacterized protein n=1 Tax=Mycena metata TaxID=1033252 RepID=A0AAD7DWD4_9AGAR|nr:hypothetical protein B0H16DRAFT_1749441 [Mycena metata]